MVLLFSKLHLKKSVLLRYKYKGIRPVLLKRGFKFDEKEGRETTAHNYQAATFPVAAAEEKAAPYYGHWGFHHRGCFSYCGAGVVFQSP